MKYGFARSRQNNRGVASAIPASPTIDGTSPLPDATDGEAYSHQLTTTGGLTPIAYSAVGLPAWLSMSAAGLLTGTPSGTSSNSFTVIATDGIGRSDAVEFSLEVVAAVSLDPADFTGYYDAETAHLTLSGSDITSYLDQGTAGINCTNVFGTKNTQEAAGLDGYAVSLGAASNDNWYRSAANASGQLAEGAGCIAVVFKASSIAENKILWALENTAHGLLYLFDDAGVKKVRATLGSGGQQVTVTGGEVTLNAWHTVIVRYNGQVVDLYLDTAAKVTATGTGGDVLATRLAQRFQLLSNGGGNCLQGRCAFAGIKNICPDDAGITDLKAAIKAKYASCGL